jgi:hypothetical protein
MPLCLILHAVYAADIIDAFMPTAAIECFQFDAQM